MTVDASNLSTWEVKARETGIQRHPWLRNEFKVSLGYMRLIVKQLNIKIK